MRNLLVDRLPDALTIAGKQYSIETDFRRWMLVLELLADDLVEVGIRLDCAAKLIFTGENPMRWGRTETFYRALAGEILWFASCGREVRGVPAEEKREKAEPVFDFGFDAERIYAAFLQVYGMDLCDPGLRLHFWKFMALLRNLPRETEFMQVVSLRRTDTTRIEDDALRRQVRRAKAQVRIRTESDWKEREEREYGRRIGSDRDSAGHGGVCGLGGEPAGTACGACNGDQSVADEGIFRDDA